MKLGKIFGFIAVGALVTLMSANASRGSEIVLRYAGQLPATHHLTLADKEFAKKVTERTNGRVKIEVYPAGQLYKAFSLVKAVMSGAVEMGITFNGAWTGPVPEMDFFEIPFLFDDYQGVENAWNGKIGDLLREKMLKFGVKTLGFGAYGESFAICNTKRPLKGPEDFRGLKIRCANPALAEGIKALQASPVMMPSAEVFMALQRGTVDGAVSGPGSVMRRKWHEATKYITFTNSTYSVWPIMINLKVWNKLSKEDQKILEEAAQEHQKWTIEKANEEDVKAVEFLSGKQEAYVIPDSDKPLWKKALVPVEEVFLKRTGADGKFLLDAVK